MYDLASLNAARRHHRRHHGHRHHNRADGMMSGAQGARLATFAGAKLAEAAVGAGLGYMDAYSGEPMFFQSKDDPTSGIGLKAGLALVSNAAQLAMLWTGTNFGSYRTMGVLGDALDGAVAGTASASFVSYMYLQGNTYGAAKRSKETSTKGVDYSAPMREMGVGAGGFDPGYGGDAVSSGQRAGAVDPFAGYR